MTNTPFYHYCKGIPKQVTKSYKYSMNSCSCDSHIHVTSGEIVGYPTIIDYSFDWTLRLKM